MERSTVLFRDPSNQGRRFVPLLLADCDLPDALRRCKYLDFRRETEAAFAELVDAILQMAAFLAPDDIPRDLFLKNSRVIAEATAALAGDHLSTTPDCTLHATGESVPQVSQPAVSPISQSAGPSDGLARQVVEPSSLPDVSEALAELRELSLLELDGGACSCHRLLQAVLLDRLPPEERKKWGQLTVKLVNAYVPRPPDDVRTWPIWDNLRPHAARSLENIGEDADTDAAYLMNQLALLLYAKAIYAEAELLYRQALAIDEKSYGSEHPSVAIRLNNLAQLLKTTNRLAEAEPLSRRAASIMVHSLGLEHPKTKTVLRVYQGILSVMQLSKHEVAARLRSLTSQWRGRFTAGNVAGGPVARRRPPGQRTGALRDAARTPVTTRTRDSVLECGGPPPLLRINPPTTPDVQSSSPLADDSPSPRQSRPTPSPVGTGENALKIFRALRP
jgi:tetratricopeptide (TPR) repeat protein